MDEDALAKVGLEALLSPFVEVRTQRPVQPAAQFVDVFVASERGDEAAMWKALGWLGKMASRMALFEAFSHPVSEDEARECIRKQLTLHHELTLLAEKGGAKVALPRLWMFSSQRPSKLLSHGEMRPTYEWPEGFYLGPEWLGYGVVVLGELPKTRETMPLRVFGDDELRIEVAREFRKTLARDDPLWRAVDRMLWRWTVWLRGQPEDERKRRLLMEFEQVVQEEIRRLHYEGLKEGLTEGLMKGILQGIDQGRAEGLDEGLRLVLLDLCEAYGIEMNAERHAYLESLDRPRLESLRLTLKSHRQWPTELPAA